MRQRSFGAERIGDAGVALTRSTASLLQLPAGLDGRLTAVRALPLAVETNNPSWKATRISVVVPITPTLMSQHTTFRFRVQLTPLLVET